MKNLQNLLRKKAIESNNSSSSNSRNNSNISMRKHQLNPGTTAYKTDLSEVIPVIKIHHQKASQRVVEKQQQQESSPEQRLPQKKHITRRPHISKIIKVQGDLQ